MLKLAIKNVFSCFCFLKVLTALFPPVSKMTCSGRAVPGVVPSAERPPQLMKAFAALHGSKRSRSLRDGFAGCHLGST